MLYIENIQNISMFSSFSIIFDTNRLFDWLIDWLILHGTEAKLGIFLYNH